MYNEERKKAYLAERKEETVLSNNLRTVFELAEKIEESLDKDLCEWGSAQIMSFYKYYSTPNLQSLIMIHNKLTAYTDWCLLNGLVRDHQNHYREIRRQNLVDCLDTGRLRDKIFTRDQLLNWFVDTPNNQDKFMFLGLFEGISVKNENLIKVKVSDFNGNTVTLNDGRTLNVTNELITFAKAAAEETEYICLSNRGWPIKLKCESSDTVLKPYYYNQVLQNKYPSWIATRIKKCLQFWGMPNIPIKDIMECGRLWYISEDMKKRGIGSIEQYIRNISAREGCERIYGKIQNHSGYLETYGQFVDLYI